MLELFLDNNTWHCYLPGGKSATFRSYIEELINKNCDTKFSFFADQQDHNKFYVIDLDADSKSQCLNIEFTIKIIHTRLPESNTIVVCDVNNPELAGHLLAQIISLSGKSNSLAVAVDKRDIIRRWLDDPNL